MFGCFNGSHLMLDGGLQIYKIFYLDVKPSHLPKTIKSHSTRQSHLIQLHFTDQTHPYAVPQFTLTDPAK